MTPDRIAEITTALDEHRAQHEEHVAEDTDWRCGCNWFDVAAALPEYDELRTARYADDQPVFALHDGTVVQWMGSSANEGRGEWVVAEQGTF